MQGNHKINVNLSNTDKSENTALLSPGYGDTPMSVGYSTPKADSSLDDTPHRAHNSVWASVFNYCCTTVGAGVVSLPYALQQSGFFGLAIVVFAASLTAITAEWLVESLYLVPGKTLNSFGEAGRECYGRRGEIFTNIFQWITLFGVCAIFLILIGENMESAVGGVLTYHDWAIMSAFFVTPVTWLKTLKEISWLALFGFAASMFVAAVVVVLSLKQVHEKAPHYDAINTGGISVGFNIIVFSFAGMSVLPSVAAEMQEPNRFPEVIRYSLVIIGSIYCIVSACAYAGWGDAVQDNVLKSAGDGVATKFAEVIISLHVFLAFPILLYALARDFEMHFGFDKMEERQELVLRIALRSSIVISALLVACAVPFFGDVLSLVSALSMIMVQFVLPVWFYYTLASRHQPHLLTTRKLALMAFIVVVGIVGTVVGLYYSIKTLVSDFEHKSPYSNFFSN